MIDIEKESKFLKSIKNNDSIEKLTKQKDNLLKLLKILLKEISNDIDLESLNNLDDSQIWAFIYNNSSQSINNFKTKTKNYQDILNELTEIININEEKEKNILGKKKKREKENENAKDLEEEEDMEENEEIEDEQNEEIEDNENEENEDEEDMDKKLKNKKKDDKKDIFFSMKDLNNFADQFEEEDNNMIKSAPNRLK